MKKKLLSVLMCVFCALMLVGCGGGKMSQFVETNKSIYDFYETQLTKVQNYALGEVSSLNAPAEDLTKINYALNGMNILLLEEMAIMASIECYNQEQNPREIYISYLNGTGIISVYQDSREFVCKITVGSTEVASYTFTISKDTEEYVLTYKKLVYEEDKVCTAKVFYDQEVSHLYVAINSYNTDNSSQNSGYGMVLETYKDFYALDKNYNAFRYTGVQGSDNTKSIYVANYYDEIGRYSLKVSKVDNVDAKIDTNRINWDQFSTSQTTEKAGYIAIYDSATTGYNLESFGDVSVW